MAAKNKKKYEQEAGSWVRLAIFTITTLEPIIKLLLARLRKRMEAVEIAETPKQAKYRNISETTHADAQEKEQKDLSKQSHVVQQELVAQNRRRWIVFGFAIGLSSASIVTFLLLRRRFRQQAEETPIQLSYNGRAPSVPPSFTDGVQVPQTTETPPLASADDTQTKSRQAIPMNAMLVGIVNTRRYYSIKTPLDQLTTAANKPVDVIYFASEEEARAQGFSAEAEKQ